MDDPDNYMDLPDEGMTERRRMAGMARRLAGWMSAVPASLPGPEQVSEVHEIAAYLERLAE